MLRKILIISTSSNKNGNSARVARAFEKGAKEAGNNVEIVAIRDKDLNFCKGCLTCQRTRKCIIEDDGAEILEMMKYSDVIVWATPIYFYDMSGQMKTMLDRTSPLHGGDYLFRDVYLIVTAADSAEDTADNTINSFKGWISCFDKVKLKGVVKALGLEKPIDLDGHPALQEAYEMGKNV